MGKVQKMLKDDFVRRNYKKNELKFLQFKYLRKELSYNSNENFKYYIHYKFIK